MSSDLFPAATTADVSREAKVEELRRELKLRGRVYSRWAAAGKMTQQQADHRILVLQAILEDYEGTG